MANEFIIKHGFHSKGNAEITGSLIVSGNISSSNGIITATTGAFNHIITDEDTIEFRNKTTGNQTGRLKFDNSTGLNVLSNTGARTKIRAGKGEFLSLEAGPEGFNSAGPITGSSHISASGNVYGITGSFSRIVGTVANTIFTLDFTSGQLNTRLFAPYNLSIDSVTNVTGSPTTNITSSGSPYTLGNAITIGTAIDVTASVSSVINLNITR